MRFYNLLLHLYPVSFRNEYADEMRPLFAQRRRAASGLGLAWLWLSTIGDVVVNGAGAHADILKQDIAYTGRVLGRSPGFAITAVLIVALGIGATTAAYTVTDFVLLRPLPFPEPDRLVKLWETMPGYPRMEASPPNFRDWKTAATSFVSMGMYYGEKATMMAGGEPRQIEGARVSADLLKTLGRSPLLGRTFTADDDRAGAPGVVILSHRFWQSELGGDAGVLGRRLVLDNDPYTVIGVMPPDFTFPDTDTLFRMTQRLPEEAYVAAERADNYVDVVARLRAGVTIEQASAEMRAIAAQLEQRFPKENKDTGASVVWLRMDEVPDRSRLLLFALLGASLCLLLIACANLANLLLARALARRRELAVRTALGAGRERLARQLMTESLLLALVGGTLGVLLAVVSTPLLAQLAPASLPFASAPSVDFRVVLFAVGLTAITGVAFGLAPIVRGGASPSLDGLREGVRSGGGHKERLRSTLVVLEIVASVVLLVSTGLLVRALLTVRAIDPGFRADGVLAVSVDLPMPAYARVAAREALYTRVLQDVRAMPGVTAAGMVSFLPISSFRGGIWTVVVKGEAPSEARRGDNVAGIRFVTPGYFKAMGTPVLRGRDVASADNRDRQFVAVVSESFVRRYFPNDDPIGQHFTFALADREIVGVVGDVKFRGLERRSEPQVYLSSQQVADGAIGFYAPKSLAVRTTGDPSSIAPAIRAAVRRADPNLPITALQTLTSMVSKETATRAVQVRVLMVFAAMAFVLAAVGIHGLLSFAVSQRTQEIGVRMALGAQSTDILWLIVRRSMLLALAGVVPGVLLAYAAGRSMEALLAGVKPADTLTLAGAVGFALLMTAIGTLAPTLRALRVDANTALRAD